MSYEAPVAVGWNSPFMTDVARRRPQNDAVDTERGVSPRYFLDVLVSSAMLPLVGFTTRKLTAAYAPLERGGLK